MSLLVSILQELPDLVVFAVGIVVFAYLCKKVLVTDKHRKSAVKIVRDILIGTVGGVIVVININGGIASAGISLAFIGVMVVIFVHFFGE